MTCDMVTPTVNLKFIIGKQHEKQHITIHSTTF